MANKALQQLTLAFSLAIVCLPPLHARHAILLFLEDAFLPMHIFFFSPKFPFHLLYPKKIYSSFKTTL